MGENYSLEDGTGPGPNGIRSRLMLDLSKATMNMIKTGFCGGFEDYVCGGGFAFPYADYFGHFSAKDLALSYF
jgi:hypothetical protein